MNETWNLPVRLQVHRVDVGVTSSREIFVAKCESNSPAQNTKLQSMFQKCSMWSNSHKAATILCEARKMPIAVFSIQSFVQDEAVANIQRVLVGVRAQRVQRQMIGITGETCIETNAI